MSRPNQFLSRVNNINIRNALGLFFPSLRKSRKPMLWIVPVLHLIIVDFTGLNVIALTLFVITAEIRIISIRIALIRNLVLNNNFALIDGPKLISECDLTVSNPRMPDHNPDLVHVLHIVVKVFHMLPRLLHLIK